jgi:hypothetical protein
VNHFTITAVQTYPSNSLDQHNIVAVRGIYSTGVGKTFLLAGIIDVIESGVKVYVNNSSPRTSVEVVTERGIKYIRTVGDSTTLNNLLSLPRF